MKLGKQKNADRFKHFMWRRHNDRNAWQNYRPELVATDGALVRRLVSQPQHIVFQAFRDAETSRRVISRIENGMGRGVAMLGYSMFSNEEFVAILHTAEGSGPGWIAFPFETNKVHFPTLPLSAADQPSLRLVGGATIDDEGGKPVLTAALEQRGERFKNSEFAFNLLDHVVDWKIQARVGNGDSARPLRMVLDDKLEPVRTDALRMQVTTPLDPVLLREFKTDNDLEFFFEVLFDRELMCLPEDWLRYWFHVSIKL